jgi:hypothetical protein
VVDQLINQSCVITSRSQDGPPDEFGTPSWTETTTTALIHVQPVASDEIEDRPAGRFTHRGWVLPTTTINHESKVTLETGQSWDVDGPPKLWTHPVSLDDWYQEVDLVGYAIDEEESS